MNKKNLSARSSSYPHRVTTERLCHGATTLTNFFFRYGANIYVFTYEKDGKKKHTFIDTGYAAHHGQIFPILEANGIDIKNIEYIIITHRHPDHSGLAASLANESGARILVHEKFKDFVEGNISAEEKRWLGGFDPSQLKKCDVEYLNCANGNGGFAINGVDFPRTGKYVEIGENCGLEILACPVSSPTHSPDQLIILYSPGKTPHGVGKTKQTFRPTDEMIFAGDLWLMKGPIFERNLRSLKLSMKFLFYRFMSRISRGNEIRRLPREQDAKAKDALKQGFCLIRVKPGHGEEFLGSNLIPKSLLADRDLLMKFGFSMDEDKSVLRSQSLVSQIAALREDAYAQFADTLNLWMELGYSPGEIPGLLARIYVEQNGGGPLVEEDRKERRKRLKELLIRLISEKNEPDDLHRIAKFTLPRL